MRARRRRPARPHASSAVDDDPKVSYPGASLAPPKPGGGGAWAPARKKIKSGSEQVGGRREGAVLARVVLADGDHGRRRQGGVDVREEQAVGVGRVALLPGHLDRQERRADPQQEQGVAAAEHGRRGNVHLLGGPEAVVVLRT